MGTNIDRERASDERVLSTKSHKLFIIWKSHVPWQIKNVISLLPRYLLPPSLTWWWFFGKEPQSTKLHVVLITWSREVTWRHMTKKKCYISTSTRPMATRCDTVITVMTYENSSTPTIVTWKNNHVTNKTRYISISTRLMATKLNKVIAYDIESPRTKSYDSLTTWSYVVSWQMKNVICSIPQVLCTPTLTG